VGLTVAVEFDDYTSFKVKIRLGRVRVRFELSVRQGTLCYLAICLAGRRTTHPRF